MTTTATNIEQRDLPAGWKWVKLGDVVEMTIGRTPSRSQPKYWAPRGHPWVSIADLRGDLITQTRESITDAGAEVFAGRMAPKGTLLFSFKLSIGKTAFAGCDLFTNEAIASFVPKNPDALDKQFLRRALSTVDFDDLTGHAVKGKTLNLRSMSAITIPLPPLEEQKRIAGILNEQMAAVEEAKKAAQDRLEAARALPAAYLREVFPSSEDELPAGWKWVNAGEVFDIQGGAQPPKAEFEQTPRDGYIRLLQIRDFESDKNAVYVKAASKLTTCSTDDVLIGRYGASVGKILTGKSGALNVAIVKTVLNEQLIHKKFLYHILISQMFQQQLLAGSSRAAQDGFNKSGISKIPIPLPPLEDQQRISSELDDKIAGVKLAEASIQQELDTIEAMPAALLRKAFAGEM